MNLININMRCIEMKNKRTKWTYSTAININMRCIEI